MRQLGLVFEVFMPGIEEPARLAGESLSEWVRRSATAKVQAAAPERPDAVILGADTVVVVGEHVLGKPRDAVDASRMLELLSGRTHEVLSGVAVAAPDGRQSSACETTRVTFRPLVPVEIQAYVRTGEPDDKAGSYGIQGRAALFVSRIEGCYFNVVGLPLARVGKMLEDVGVLVYRCW